ncbi:MAG: leucine--tRNA ligase [Candidatus Pacearchaeota archaeon]|jgi:leucyl-tRNA synthetase
MTDINFAQIEKKWQKKWEQDKIFEVKEGKGKKYYVLEMFPYPSGDGLHIGHAFNYIIGDIYARFKRMSGFNVLYPMGYDSLGLPAENAAIKAKIHPREYTEKAVANYIRQQKELGLSYDWNRMVKTHDPEYYKWDQWIFLKLFEKGLAYRKKAPVNWCPKCDTVLANEQVHGGKCWRHEDTDVEIKHLEQWFFKITEYANELYDKVDSLKWPERIKAMQKNWIGKSHGTEINFEINGENWPVFTTRPDTIYGVTFMVISAQHPRLMELVTKEQKSEVEKFLKKITSTSEKDMEELNKEGAFTGSYAINPITGDKIPVWAGNFVVADYGCGMVMAVPSHDQRDFEFAKKYKIPIIVVIQPDAFELNAEKMSRAYTGDGRLANSEEFNGWSNREAIDAITDYLHKIKKGKKVVNFKLRDWLVSRQRYWGTPIPIVYCDTCGIVPVPEKELPVELPKDVKFGQGNPLLTSKEFANVKCPKCKGKARRETDTMDTFVNSSWYYLRYCDAHNSKEIFDKKKVAYWCPIDQYIGGAEHACMHLIYFRFYTKFFRDLGMINFGEPAERLFNQGMVHGNDGAVMSKSRGNVVLPEEVSKKYGIDTARLFLMSIASPDKDIEWSDRGVEGSLKFVKRVIEYFSLDNLKKRKGKTSARIESKLNKTIKEVSQDIEEFRYNLAIIKIRQLFEAIEAESEISKKDLEDYLKLLSPFCPHIAEELWENLGNKPFISVEKWPVADESKIDLKLEQAEKAAEKTVEDVFNILRIVKENAHKSKISGASSSGELKEGKEPEKVYLYVIPNELGNYNNEVLAKRLNKKVFVFAVNDSKKYDPKGLAGKAKPGRPAIYVE